MKIFIYSFFICLVLISCGGSNNVAPESSNTGSSQSATPTGNISGQVEIVESTN